MHLTDYFNSLPIYLVARGVCRLALEHQKNVSISLGTVLGDMLRFAVFYFLVLGIPTAVEGAFFVLPGVLIVCLCALIILARDR